MARAGWKERRDVNCAALMDLLKRAAEAGRACPDAGDIARSLKLTKEMVGTCFVLLRADRRIDWTIVYCGPGIGKRRWVTLHKEGLQTAKPVKIGRAYIRAPRDDSALARAKVILQRRGCYVWDAPVTEGAAYRGMVKVDRKILKPAAVIAMAGL